LKLEPQLQLIIGINCKWLKTCPPKNNWSTNKRPKNWVSEILISIGCYDDGLLRVDIYKKIRAGFDIGNDISQIKWLQLCNQSTTSSP
jgi:hypothetical protein